VRDHCSYDYAIVRVVPRVEREEFLNVGVIVSCMERDFLDARIELDESRLKAFDPTLDLDSIRESLASIPLICAGGPESGPIGQLKKRERFHWLIAPRSTVVQVSPMHSGRCASPNKIVEHLLETMVRVRTVRALG
jgi:hypothetical protein